MSADVDGAEVDRKLHLFEGYGVELEYGIVDRETLGVKPVADRLLAEVAGGETEAEVELGEIAWSNELVLHVIELKTNGPREALPGLGAVFQEHVRRIGGILEPLGARLLPTGMHPWMDPATQTRLWPHEYGPVYRAFDRIFGCKGHGWGNLQSTHLNLPFAGDEEFGRLHDAIRLVLPILPALAASTPVADGRVTGMLDTRMDVYRNNANRVPSVMGRVVPERVTTASGYEALLESVYRDLEPHDPEGILRHPWVNARGAIARFDRGSIEIRVIDSQECPAADVAVTAAATAVVRALVEGRLPGLGGEEWPAERLAGILTETIREADDALIEETGYLKALGWTGRGRVRAGEVWAHLVEATLPPAVPGADEWRPHLEVILGQGCLARRILAALGGPGPGTEPARARLAEVYRALADSIERGESFRP